MNDSNQDCDIEVAAVRGILWGLLVSIPLWAIIIGVVYVLYH